MLVTSHDDNLQKHTQSLFFSPVTISQRTWSDLLIFPTVLDDSVLRQATRTFYTHWHMCKPKFGTRSHCFGQQVCTVKTDLRNSMTTPGCFSRVTNVRMRVPFKELPSQQHNSTTIFGPTGYHECNEFLSWHRWLLFNVATSHIKHATGFAEGTLANCRFADWHHHASWPFDRLLLQTLHKRVWDDSPGKRVRDHHVPRINENHATFNVPCTITYAISRWIRHERMQT